MPLARMLPDVLCRGGAQLVAHTPRGRQADLAGCKGRAFHESHEVVDLPFFLLVSESSLLSGPLVERRAAREITAREGGWGCREGRQGSSDSNESQQH